MDESVQTILGDWINESRERGAEPPRRMIGHMARELKLLTDEGVTFDELRAALHRMFERGGLHPSVLPTVVYEVRLRGTAADGTDPVRAFLAEHEGRWPTGTRLVRGSHSATCVQDPLGYDPPDRGVGWGRPTRDEILRALRAKGEHHVDIRPAIGEQGTLLGEGLA